MEKEEYRKAFNAGKEYWSWVQTDEPLMHKPIDFDEWYDTIVLPQTNVIGSLQEHKEVIRELMNTYIININDDGEPKSSITEIMKLIDRVVSLVGDDR